MSKNLLMTILLSDLKTVRLKCKGKDGERDCKTVFEIPMDRLAEFFRENECKCSRCGTPFYVQKQDGARLYHLNAFRSLADAIRDLNSVEGKVEVEFIIPDNGGLK